MWPCRHLRDLRARGDAMTRDDSMGSALAEMDTGHGGRGRHVIVDVGHGGLLDRLPEADRAELERRGTRRRYRAGAPLFHEGDPSDWVAVVLGGRVKVSVIAGGGKEVVLAVCS